VVVVVAAAVSGASAQRMKTASEAELRTRAPPLCFSGLLVHPPVAQCGEAEGRTPRPTHDWGTL
jgi:hypothetical protein